MGLEPETSRIYTSTTIHHGIRGLSGMEISCVRNQVETDGVVMGAQSQIPGMIYLL